MNRKFQPREETRIQIISCRFGQISHGSSGYYVNLHQGYVFTLRSGSMVLESSSVGQCNVIDAPTFDLPDGRRLELEHFARKVTGKINLQIADKCTLSGE